MGWRRVLAMATKEVHQIRRDPKIMVMVVVAPVFQLFLYGYAATFDLHLLPLAVLDRDGSPEVRTLLAKIEASGEFAIVRSIERTGEAEDLFDRGLVRGVLVFPPGFGQHVRAGDGRARVAIWLDGSDSNTATIVRASIEQIVLRHSILLAVDEAGARDARLAASLDAATEGEAGLPEMLDVRTRVLYNPELKSAHFMVPGVFAIILLVMTTMLSALSVARERELGTFEMMTATPIRPGELIVGKLLPFIGIGFGDVLLVLAAAAFWFEIPIRGSVGLVLLFAAAYVLGTIGLGLLISSWCETQRQAMVVTFAALLPMMLLSGFVFPIHSMPWGFQVVAYMLPVTYFLDAVRGILLRGVGLDVLWPDLAAVAGLGAIILAASVIRFRARIA